MGNKANQDDVDRIYEVTKYRFTSIFIKRLFDLMNSDYVERHNLIINRAFRNDFLKNIPDETMDKIENFVVDYLMPYNIEFLTDYRYLFECFLNKILEHTKEDTKKMRRRRFNEEESSFIKKLTTDNKLTLKQKYAYFVLYFKDDNYFDRTYFSFKDKYYRLKIKREN